VGRALFEDIYMITIVPLDMSPASFGEPVLGWEKPKRKIIHTNSVLVFSAKNTKKVTLQIRTSSHIVNVWLDGEEAIKVANALTRKNIK
jgi:hypothetical protein